MILGVKYPGLVGDVYEHDVRGRRRHGSNCSIDRDWYQAWSRFPNQASACWSGSASCGPLAHVRLAKAIEENNQVLAKEVTLEIQAAGKPFLPGGSLGETFSKYNIELEKIRINAAGSHKGQTSRPPYIKYPDDFASDHVSRVDCSPNSICVMAVLSEKSRCIRRSKMVIKKRAISPNERCKIVGNCGKALVPSSGQSSIRETEPPCAAKPPPLHTLCFLQRRTLSGPASPVCPLWRHRRLTLAASDAKNLSFAPRRVW